MRINALEAVGFLELCVWVSVCIYACMHVCVSHLFVEQKCPSVSSDRHLAMSLWLWRITNPVFASSHWPTVLHSPWPVFQGDTVIPSHKKPIPDIFVTFHNDSLSARNLQYLNIITGNLCPSVTVSDRKSSAPS